MRVLTAVALLGFASRATAECPNLCSGHGFCGDNMVCTCFDGWMFADCSERVCPYEIAFADEPSAAGTFHNYVECSGRGICDRDSGECECLEGYTGKACKRMACPNDCSGHGTCERMKDLTYTSTPGSYSGDLVESAHSFGHIASQSWEWDKAMACKCDPGYIDIDCSRRMCPKGNDVVDQRVNTDDTFQWQKQVITFHAAGTAGDGAGSAASSFVGMDFALTFVSGLNESFTTIPIEIADVTSIPPADVQNDIRDALIGLPNKVITDCNVAVAFVEMTIGSSYGTMIIQVEFTGSSVMGPQNLLIPVTEKCGDGCTPMLTTGMDLKSFPDSNMPYLSSVAEIIAADFNSYECGRRGKCDYDEGICECFEGYYGQSCQNITALV